MSAVKVGKRRNAPVALFEIETKALPEPVGRTSPDSAVWLTTFVPAKLLWKISDKPLQLFPFFLGVNAIDPNLTVALLINSANNLTSFCIWPSC